MLRLIRVLTCAFVLLGLELNVEGLAPKPKAAWRKTNWDDAEKKLEEGDLPDLLVTEDKIAMDDYDRRRGEGLKMPEDDVALKEGNEWLRHTQAMSGPAMMFVSLKPTDPKGKAWTKKSLERLSVDWSSMCKTAGLEAKVYDISEGAQDTPTRTRKPSPLPGAGTVSETPTPTATPYPPARMLVSMNSGWRGYDLRDFMLRREEIESLEWDQVKYTPADLDEEGNFKGGVTGKNAAPLPAGLADMAAKPAPSKFGKGGKGSGGGGGGGAKKRATPTPRPAEEEEEEEEEEF